MHQRLLNRARESGRPFNELLQHFAIERFLYRLSKSRHADRFILKGALMLSVWSGASSRPTKDIDLLGRIDNSLEAIAVTMKDVCETDVEVDGMVFDEESVTPSRITEDAVFEASSASDVERQVQWAAFVGRSMLNDAPRSFSEVAGAVTSFLKFPTLALAEGRPFSAVWTAPGSWR